MWWQLLLHISLLDLLQGYLDLIFQTILGDFSKEQAKFVAEKNESKRLEDAAVPPWVGYNEEEAMKSQILALSTVSIYRLLSFISRE